MLHLNYHAENNMHALLLCCTVALFFILYCIKLCFLTLIPLSFVHILPTVPLVSVSWAYYLVLSCLRSSYLLFLLLSYLYYESHLWMLLTFVAARTLSSPKATNKSSSFSFVLKDSSPCHNEHTVSEYNSWKTSVKQQHRHLGDGERRVALCMSAMFVGVYSWAELCLTFVPDRSVWAWWYFGMRSQQRQDAQQRCEKGRDGEAYDWYSH